MLAMCSTWWHLVGLKGAEGCCKSCRMPVVRTGLWRLYTSPDKRKKQCKPSAHYACAVSLMASTRGLHAKFEHRIATLVDSMRESIHAFRCDFICLQISYTERVEQVAVSQLDLLAFSLVFTPYLSNAVVSGNDIFLFRLWWFWSSWYRSVVAGDKRTHAQTKYCNPRCACVPRV